MNLRRILAGLLSLSLTCGWSIAQRTERDATPDGGAQKDEQTERDTTPDRGAQKDEGFWPTRKMVELVLNRYATSAAQRYELDEYQTYELKKKLNERIGKFLSRNRAELQPVANEWLETMLGYEPPSVEYAADWAGRALPILAEFQEVVGGLTAEMSEYLTEEQQVMLEGDRRAFELAAGFMSGRLQVWKNGQYDPEIDFTPLGEKPHEVTIAEQRELADAMESARRNGMAAERRRLGKPPTEPDVAGEQGVQPPAKQGPRRPTDEWVAYVEQFKRVYKLDRDQSAQADRLLKQATEHRESYLRTKTDEMKRITKLYERGKNKLADGRYEKLNVAIGNMFERLKEKLHKKVLRRDQRRAAGELAERK